MSANAYGNLLILQTFATILFLVAGWAVVKVEREHDATELDSAARAISKLKDTLLLATEAETIAKEQAEQAMQSATRERQQAKAIQEELEALRAEVKRLKSSPDSNK